jgi:FlaA1/EpsC-like NDP-sugar epimerase
MQIEVGVQFKSRLIDLPRSLKRTLLVLADGGAAIASLALAFSLKFDSLAAMSSVSPWIFLWAAASAALCFASFGLYHAVLRFMSVPALAAIVLGSLGSAGLLWLVSDAYAGGHVTLTLCGIYVLVLVATVSGIRIFARWLVSPAISSRVPVIIYGAGDAGARLAASLSRSGNMFPVAYVDEKETLQGSTIAGIRVRPPDALRGLTQRYGIKHVLLAIPGASRRRRSEIIGNLMDLGVHVQTVPDLYEIVSGAARVGDLREVSVADLLGRDPVAPQAELLGACIAGKSVMVTGAGGSIGSELCRQIISQQPRKLILYELSEVALYQIDKELRLSLQRGGHATELVSLIGNTRHKDRLKQVMQSYGVQTVYHAAAYKHVPIVEQNIIEGVHNNVLATWTSAEAAIAARVETFVLISTDKAVNPTNVMGATKRFAEIVLQALQKRQLSTKLCMVRFGNVLGSSGSVVPLFQEQIRAGGPVTVTHQQVRRYFMTIPEAASLVLQAGSMAKGGEVFVLDMGQPVLIDDLARRMIALAGHSVRDERNPDGEIPIQYSGLRPGEKLFEELLIGDNVSGTQHPMIMRAMEHEPGWEVAESLLHRMTDALNAFDCEKARAILSEAVVEYHPAPRLHDLVWESTSKPVVTKLADRRP